MKIAFPFLLFTGILAAAEWRPPVSLAGFPARDARSAAQSPAALLDFLAREWRDDSGKILSTTPEELRFRLAQELARGARTEAAWGIYRENVRHAMAGSVLDEPYRFRFKLTEPEPRWTESPTSFFYPVLTEILKSKAFKQDEKFRDEVWSHVEHFVLDSYHPIYNRQYSGSMTQTLTRQNELGLAQQLADRLDAVPRRKRIPMRRAMGFIPHIGPPAKTTVAVKKMSDWLATGKHRQAREYFAQLDKPHQASVAVGLIPRFGTGKLPFDEEEALHYAAFISIQHDAIHRLVRISESFLAKGQKPKALMALNHARDRLPAKPGWPNKLVFESVAMEYAQQGQFKTAEELAPHAWKTHRIYFYLSRKQRIAKNLPEARRLLHKAGQLDLGIRTRMELARHWEALNAPQQARAALETAVREFHDPKCKLHPSLFGTVFDLAEELRALGDNAAANALRESIVNRALNLKDRDIRLDVIAAAIESYMESGEFKKTAQWIEWVMDQNWAVAADAIEERLKFSPKVNLFEGETYLSGFQFTEVIPHHHWREGYTPLCHWWSAANQDRLGAIVNPYRAEDWTRLRQVLPHLKQPQHREWIITAVVLENISDTVFTKNEAAEKIQLAKFREWIALLPDAGHRAKVAEVFQYWHAIDLAGSWNNATQTRWMAKVVHLKKPEWRSNALRAACKSLLHDDPEGARKTFEHAWTAARKIAGRPTRVAHLLNLARLSAELEIPLAGWQMLRGLMAEIRKLPADLREPHFSNLVAIAGLLQHTETFHRALGEIQSPKFRRAATVAAALELSFQRTRHQPHTREYTCTLKPAFTPTEQKAARAILSAWAALAD